MPTLSLDKTIEVYLDSSGNPAVEVDPVVLGRRRSVLIWKREPGTPAFDFDDIQFSPATPFTVQTITASTIVVGNDGTAGDYEYTITVRSGKDEYTTTKSGPPTGNRPVIRN